MGTGLILKPWSDVHNKSRRPVKHFRHSVQKMYKNLLSNIWHYKATNYNNKQHKIIAWFEILTIQL